MVHNYFEIEFNDFQIKPQHAETLKLRLQHFTTSIPDKAH